MAFPRAIINGSDPGADFVAVTPDDDTDLAPHRSLWVSVAGEVHVQNMAGQTVPLGDLPVGTVIPGRAVRLMEATIATVVLIV